MKASAHLTMIERQPEDAAPVAAADSIEALYEAKESVLLRYAQRLVRDSETAQDVVQEAFMRLHAEFESVKQPVPWLYRTVHNLALNQRRAERKIVPMPVEEENREIPDCQPLPDEQIVRMEAIGETRLCMEALDARQQELIRLKFEEELSYQEISDRTQLSTGNVGYLLHHALKELAAALKKTGVVS